MENQYIVWTKEWYSKYFKSLNDIVSQEWIDDAIEDTKKAIEEMNK